MSTRSTVEVAAANCEKAVCVVAPMCNVLFQSSKVFRRRFLVSMWNRLFKPVLLARLISVETKGT